jgi:UDP:flavonoid glycosyltransferase YjiC (YdhE family)
MPTILLVWELGGGRGHLGPLRQLAERLIDRGHHMFLASRNVVAAGELFSGLPVGLFAAPFLPGTPSYAVSPVRSFVDILHNVGFGSRDDLVALASAWLSIYTAVRPDAIVFDHSPTALAASYAFPTRRILLGTGFACPPPGRETEDLRIWLGNRRESTSQTAVLNNLNALCELHGLEPLESVGQLFAEVDATLLATFPELDHFGARDSGQYVGVFPFPPGAPPQWPRDSRPRAFAYLKPHKLVESVVAELTELRVPTILYTGSDDPEAARRYATNYVHVSPMVLDLQTALVEADFAILNGTHATTSAALLAGKATVQFPLLLEQWVLAERVAELAAGFVVPANRAQLLPECLRRTASGEGRDGARTFAAKYAQFDRQASVNMAVESIESAIRT